MKCSKYIILICCSIILRNACFAQETSPQSASKSSNKAITIGIHPLFLFNKTVKLDAEFQKADKPLAYVVGVEWYNGNINDLYRKRNSYGEKVEDRIAGFGINAAVKYKFSQSGRFNSYYFSPGVTFRHLVVKLDGPMFYSYMEDGMEYFLYGQAQKDIAINPVLLYGTFGRYFEIDGFVLDMYFGLGHKLLKQNKELQTSRHYHEAMYGYNYSGATFLLGFKFGFQITK